MRITKHQYCLILIALYAILGSNLAYSWGQNGHRITGLIAERHLTKAAAAKLKPLLGGDTLPEVTTWADEMRSSPDEFWQKQASRWHYININDWSDFKQHETTLPYRKHVTNLYQAIMRCITVLQNKDATQSEKEKHLRLLTHFVGDAHQPLHVGRAADRGGNAIDIRFFGEPTNLHSLWDTALVESENLSFTEFADFIDTSDPVLIKNYLNSSIQDWLKESHEIAKTLYAVKSDNYRWQYLFKHMPTLKKRLLQSGIRLAGLLNLIFDPNAKTGVAAIPVGKLH